MPVQRSTRVALFLIVAMAATRSPDTRAVEEGVCPERPPRLSAAAKSSNAAKENPPIDIRARELRTTQGGVNEFTGNVVMQQGDQRLTADHLRYDKSTGLSDASGNVNFRDSSGSNFVTPAARLNLESRIGYAGPSTFRLLNDNARGDAQHIDFAGPDLTLLKRARYTTCAPGQDDWFLKMRELKLDTEQNIGTAYDSSVNFMGVPVFYLPYLTFPISDERKSGFLMPRLGQSTQRGLELAAPYYFNLAPNYDATITPQFMSKRGLQWQTEFRYLTPHSQGKLELEALPNDRMANGDDRAAGTYQHQQVFNSLWSGNIDIRGVSDKLYFNDFGDDIGVTSQTHLPQNAQLDYRGPVWNFSTRAAAYQTIDPTIAPTDRPYARLPQINLALNRPLEPNRMNYHFESEVVNFKRNVGVTGERLNLSPAISLPLSNSYGFVTPKIGVRSIAYHVTSAPDETPTLTRGVFSLDSGLVFERDSLWGKHLFTQTLEPRLYYLYIPAKGQDSLPNFDTGFPDFSFSNLFRDNRFSGGDRIGDSNQLTAAVTSRFIDDNNGVERARASLGRIYYFADREVNLPSGPTSGGASDLVGEITTTLHGNWYTRGNIQWDRAENRFPKYSYYFQYNPAKNRILNIGKQFSSGELAQIDVSAEWPITGRWSFRARSIYSSRDSRNVDSYAGVDYNACCWAVRILGSRRLSVDTANNNAATQVSAIMFELELTGLSKFGHIPDSPLRQSMFSFPQNSPTSPGLEVP